MANNLPRLDPSGLKMVDFIQKICDRFLTEQTGLYKSLKTLVISEQLSQDDVNKLTSFFLEYINSKKFWYLDDQQLYLNSVISSQDLIHIDTQQDILVKIPLKSGDYQELYVPSIQSLVNSPRLKEVIDNGLKS